jgi:CO dehydrogenase nickel-insertion accessory protein CooC1
MQVCKQWRNVGHEVFLTQQGGWMILMASCSKRCDELVNSLISIRLKSVSMNLFVDAAEFFRKENRAKILRWLVSAPNFDANDSRVRNTLYKKAWEDKYPLTKLVFGKCENPSESCKCYKAHSDEIG